MLLQKQGFPQEDELVLCTVTAVQYHSVFCKLDEYGKTGMIHISEVAPGRIRNTRDYVKEGKKIVCKVLRINKEKEQIDLSLRRVNETQKRQKLNQIKQEQLAEKIVEQAAKKHNKAVMDVFNALSKALLPKYGGLFPAFEEAAQGNIDFSNFVDKKVAAELAETIKQRIKPKEVTIKGDLVLSTYAPNGVELIKKVLKKGNKTSIRYKGAGAYHVEVVANDYKTAEKTLKTALEAMLAEAKTNKVVAEFKREEHV